MTAGASENTQIQIGSNLNENLIRLMMFYSNLGQERGQARLPHPETLSMTSQIELENFSIIRLNYSNLEVRTGARPRSCCR